MRMLVLRGRVQRRRSLDWVVGIKSRYILLVSWWHRYGEVNSPQQLFSRLVGL